MKQEAPQNMTPERAQEILDFAKDQAHQMFQKLPMLGPVTWLMMQQPHTRHTLVSELEWRVVPAMMLDQAKLYMRGDAPLAYVSWARMSKEVAQRYRQPPHQLSFSDWNSGDEVWLIDMVAPFGGIPKVMEALRSEALAGQVIHQLAPAASGPARVVSWPAA
ncbi:MAG: toxin-activating lysine-acyltransferase [Hydrogenophaga sp.]|jgi:cytolysin-activating lysine-acyltransferase|nr:toxin-activating lysine-acyltransferase [Hydrogenophaga sp.]